MVLPRANSPACPQHLILPPPCASLEPAWQGSLLVGTKVGAALGTSTGCPDLEHSGEEPALQNARKKLSPRTVLEQPSSEALFARPSRIPVRKKGTGSDSDSALKVWKYSHTRPLRRPLSGLSGEAPALSAGLQAAEPLFLCSDGHEGLLSQRLPGQAAASPPLPLSSYRHILSFCTEA
ncbi:cytosolic carboxypeptidase-like protein 5 [Alligator mississippiensis]|uniref:Cytosolic carboxypeptidase-like protein 5 n=1 Tax=Alligator mississippiensis TaxID=8496 RepID=A0A151NRG1_ALLMI|nr:cytosolic carboxypeptidase-like protein 5 [Alligator mississippiensis]